MSMLSDYKDSEVVHEYLNELTKIKNQYDLINISFGVDFSPKNPADKKYLEESVQKIVKFKSYIDTFRNKLVK